jgi:hypothetical protein
MKVKDWIKCFEKLDPDLEVYSPAIDLSDDYYSFIEAGFCIVDSAKQRLKYDDETINEGMPDKHVQIWGNI